VSYKAIYCALLSQNKTIARNLFLHLFHLFSCANIPKTRGVARSRPVCAFCLAAVPAWALFPLGDLPSGKIGAPFFFSLSDAPPWAGAGFNGKGEALLLLTERTITSFFDPPRESLNLIKSFPSKRGMRRENRLQCENLKKKKKKNLGLSMRPILCCPESTNGST